MLRACGCAASSRLCACMYMPRVHHPAHTIVPPAIFSDWAWPGFLLPCFLLCIPNYGGEFLGRTTRIARFGLISSLNLDISRLQPFALASHPHFLERASLRRSADLSIGPRDLFFYLFFPCANYPPKKIIYFSKYLIKKN